jgi:ADP-L-glycero-D-manno-heptose 6-epimerase
VNLFFFDNADKSGIFNVGTGRSQTFNDVALAVVNCLRRARKESPLELKQMQAQGMLEYIEFPPGLADKYQSFTEADVGALRRAGYKKEFLTVEQGVSRYVDRLLKK